jgi:hypothetical protein
MNLSNNLSVDKELISGVSTKENTITIPLDGTSFDSSILPKPVSLRHHEDDIDLPLSYAKELVFDFFNDYTMELFSETQVKENTMNLSKRSSKENTNKKDLPINIKEVGFNCYTISIGYDPTPNKILSLIKQDNLIIEPEDEALLSEHEKILIYRYSINNFMSENYFLLNIKFSKKTLSRVNIFIHHQIGNILNFGRLYETLKRRIGFISERINFLSLVYCIQTSKDIEWNHILKYLMNEVLVREICSYLG